MNTFRKDGVYIKVNDKSKEGYYTYDKPGILKKHKYGFLDKLHDIYYEGKTTEISYSFIFFRNPTENETQLYMGTIGGEFTAILKGFSRGNFSNVMNKHHLVKFSFLSDSKAKYLDNKDRECYLICNENGSAVTKHYYDFVKEPGESLETEFNFFPQEL